jgi:hypothetical protein
MDPATAVGTAMNGGPPKHESTKYTGHESTKARKQFTGFVAGLLLLVALPVSAADRYALIVTGASGGAPYDARYTAWRTSFVTTLKEDFGYPADRLVVLSEDAQPGLRSTRENVKAAFQAFARKLVKDDQLLVLLIGHGTAGDENAKFNLVGPDLTAAEWGTLLTPIAARVVFVNTSSASFEYLDRLAARGRIVVTATDAAAQQFATIFPEFFVSAFATPKGEPGSAASPDREADLDRNGRVSIWEAFRAASAGVKGWFEAQGRLATERPLLDDNGDGVGREADAPGDDGALAEVTYLQPEAGLPGAVDPAMAEQLRRRAELQSRLDAHRAAKATLPPDQYERELEALILELARLDAEIRKGG